jgi:hypothetical protein
MKLVRLIKMCLNETCSRVHAGKLLSDIFITKNGLKQGDALLPLLFKFALEYAIRRALKNQDGLKLNGTHQLLVYDDNVNPLASLTLQSAWDLNVPCRPKHSKALLLSYTF